MRYRRNLLVSILLDPEQALTLDLPSWDLLVRQARNSQLLARLATALSESELIDRVPERPRQHLYAVTEIHNRQSQAVNWEIEHLTHALVSRGLRLVLLKGAAYFAARLPPARGRLFSDLDILVPREQLSNAELALLSQGWTSAQTDAYDDRYYRTWMHELPPMRHFSRLSVIDVHHNLVPDTAPLHPDPRKLLDDAIPCSDRPDVFVLAPNDMILHSAVHLFNDGEFDHALRDLFDLRDLILHFVHTSDDWHALTKRALELELGRPLHHALRCLESVLNVKGPEAAFQQLSIAAPGTLVQSICDFLFSRGLQPDHESCKSTATNFARLALYFRGHALRMPPHLLIPHLVRKSVMRIHDKAPTRVENAQR